MSAYLLRFTLILLIMSLAYGFIPRFDISHSKYAEFPLVAEAETGSKEDFCKNISFHYIVFENYLMTAKVRRIEVFMDVKAFSEENLKTLFCNLSDDNPTPEHLTIAVFTDWAQIPIASNFPITVISEQPDEKDRYDYHEALFARRRKGGIIEYFTYNPELKTYKVKLVVLKGKAPK